MFTGSRSFLVLVVALGCGALVRCAEPTPNGGDDHTSETVIQGRAPLNAGGIVRVTTHGGHRAGTTYEEAIRDDGSFLVKAHGASGKVTLEAIGGSYTEPANGSVVHHAGERLRAALLDVQQLTDNEVAITPWSEIAYVRGGLDGYGEGIKALTDMLSCQGTPYIKLLQAPPALPADGIQSLTTPGALAYVYMGAFSQLADDLSNLYGVQTGTRLTSMRLAKVLAEDFADGRVDGKNKDGGTVYLLDGHPLPADVLRQQLAQSTRRFLKVKKPQGDTRDWGNDSTIGETAMLDFLRCISESTDPQLGPPGEPLDRDGPVLSVATPEPGGYLSSSQDVVCEAHDRSGVAALDAVFLRDGVELPEARGDGAAMVGEEGHRRFVAPLRIEKLLTGDVAVRCDATDRWGNPNTLAVPFHVNRGGIAPQNKVHAEDTNHLTGHVEITCDCQADVYSERCELEPPEGGKGLEVVEQGDRKITYNWDTRQVLDGPRNLICANTTRGLPRPLVQSRPIYVKNHENGIANGAVYLDTPVRGMQVTAFAFEDGERGRQLGGTEVDDDGKFKFLLSTEYRGPVLLRAEYSRSPDKLAEFHNVPLDAPMSCTNAVLTLLIEHYEPGEPLAGLSINVVTTMHEAFAGSLWRLGKEPTFYAAARTAYTLVSNYISGSGKAFDPRRTWVANLSLPGRTDHEQMVMGLFHVGLSRLAVDRSLHYCQGSDACITISEIIEAMRRDLSDGNLDGKADGAPVYMPFHAPLTEDFFRIDLARGIRRWLDKTPYLGGKNEPINKSGLTAEAMTPRSPVLQNLAKHHSALFDNRPGEDYDGDGPRIEWRAYGADQNLLDLERAPLGDTSFRLAVKATDESGIARMEVTLNDEPLENQAINAEAGNGEYVLHTGKLDGPQQIKILALDGQGNPPTVESVNFVVDRVLPEVALERDELWINDGATYRLVGTVAKPHVTAQVFVNDVAVGGPLHVDAKTFEVPLPLVCGASHHVRIEVRDAAGNGDHRQQVVHCDKLAPTINHLDSWFTNVQDGKRQDLTHRLINDQGSTPIDLTEESKNIVIEALWNHLDDTAGDELPTLNFSVSDTTEGYGALTPELKVSYKYVYRDGPVTSERDWSPVQCTSRGFCKIPLSYQTLLPEGILNQPIEMARRQNFIAYSKGGHVHTVLVKVEDLAHNTTMAAWSFRLKLFTPPVTVDCGFHPAFTGTRLWDGPGGSANMPSLSDSAFPSLYVNINASLEVDGRSLTPSDASHVFGVTDTSLEWRIDKVYEAQGGRVRARTPGDGSSLLASQSVAPRHQEVELRGDGDRQVHNPLFTKNRVEFQGQPLKIATIGNRAGTYLGPVRWANNARIIRRTSKPEYKGSRTNSPPPVRIETAAGCDNDITASWQDGGEPTIHVGPAPDLYDVESYYH